MGRLSKCLSCDLIIAICLITIFLSSCQTHHVKRDGPPNFYVDESKIHNAVPKAEPLAKYGNMRSYRVFGKRYAVMRSFRHYDEVGIASWYGTQFHSHKTSSGERYNMLSMTAAHKTLPLPTYVRVTNLKNRRQVIVKVNDRGPFAPGRIIDVSYVAAKKLGMIGHGTAPVRVTAIDPWQYNRAKHLFASRSSWRPQVNKTAQPNRTYNATFSVQPVYLQVGAFRDLSNAIKLKQRLMHYFVTPVKIAYPTIYEAFYRVQIGPFKDVIAADKITDQLKSLGIQSNKKFGV